MGFPEIRHINTREQKDHLFLDVLNQERRRTQVIHRKAKEALDLLLMQVHGDDVCQSWGWKKQSRGTTVHCTARFHKEQVDINFILLPALASIDASSLLTIEPLFLILHCLL